MFRLPTVVATAVLMLAVPAATAGSASAEPIRACIEEVGGRATLWDIKIQRGSRCPAETTPISWNRSGVRGPVFHRAHKARREAPLRPTTPQPAAELTARHAA